MKTLAMLISGGLLLAGCSHQPALVGRADLVSVADAALPPPSRLDLEAPIRPYVIGPFDQINVEVFGLPEFSRSMQADAAGNIAYPLVGSLRAAGRTPEELAGMIANGLNRTLRDPQVTVNVTDTVSNLVTVSGEVREPGLYPVLGEMTLIRAVASAKGLGEFAAVQEIVVFRTVEGREYAALYDMNAIRRGIYPDPAIYANDVVVVGDSPTRRLLRDAFQAAPILTAPIIAVLQN